MKNIILLFMVLFSSVSFAASTGTVSSWGDLFATKKSTTNVKQKYVMEPKKDLVPVENEEKKQNSKYKKSKNSVKNPNKEVYEAMPLITAQSIIEAQNAEFENMESVVEQTNFEAETKKMTEVVMHEVPLITAQSIIEAQNAEFIGIAPSDDKVVVRVVNLNTPSADENQTHAPIKILEEPKKIKIKKEEVKKEKDSGFFSFFWE